MKVTNLVVVAGLMALGGSAFAGQQVQQQQRSGQYLVQPAQQTQADDAGFQRAVARYAGFNGQYVVVRPSEGCPAGYVFDNYIVEGRWIGGTHVANLCAIPRLNDGGGNN